MYLCNERIDTRRGLRVGQPGTFDVSSAKSGQGVAGVARQVPPHLVDNTALKYTLLSEKSEGIDTLIAIIVNIV